MTLGACETLDRYGCAMSNDQPIRVGNLVHGGDLPSSELPSVRSDLVVFTAQGGAVRVTQRGRRRYGAVPLDVVDAFLAGYLDDCLARWRADQSPTTGGAGAATSAREDTDPTNPMGTP